MSWIRRDAEHHAKPASTTGRGQTGPATGSASLRLPQGRLGQAVATLDPGYFALVMAAGIVSTGCELLGYITLSRVLLGFTVAGFIVLTAAYTVRLALYRGFVQQSLGDPTTAMGYFTVVAGTDVLASRVSINGHPLVVLCLGIPAAVLWAVLSYGLP